MTLLAVDAGTSAVKAAAIDQDGTVLAEARTAAPPRAGAGVDPDVYWAVAAETIRSVSDRRRVAAVAVTGQGDGLWGLDGAGEASGPAYEWNTTLAASVVRDWEADGTIDAHYRAGATVLWPGTSAALWRWLAQARPDQARRTEVVFCAKDWINNRLCGAIATDITDATIPFLDLDTGEYSPVAFDRLGCRELVRRMPPIRPAGAEIGTVSGEAALATGLPEGTPVLMGCIDVAAMAYGAGLGEPGQALLVLGTTAAALVVVGEVDRSGEAVGATLRLPGGRRYLRVLGTSSGTSTLDWCLDTLGYAGENRLEDFWTDVGSGTPGAYMMPYLAGERAPFLAPDATGALLGLTPATGRSDVARSMVMGITFSLRHCLDETLPGGVDSVVLAGGGATSAEWCQLVADVTGATVVAAPGAATACEGVARLVTGRTGALPEGSGVHEPEGGHESEYREFVELARRLRPIWSEMAAWRHAREESP